MKAFLSLSILVFVPTIIGKHVSCSLIGPSITLSDGVVLGNNRNSAGVLSFKGIPFAEPPVGNLRWTSPRPPTPWSGTLNATEFGYSCWNNLVGGPVFSPYNEDCLTINVWTAAVQSTEKRPVMFWIYPGGFQFGSSASPLYNGSSLAEEGVVVVSFNYRLGVFGFLGLTELDDEGPYPSGDYGLQDQLAALRWVQQNIAAFGGDPNKVTIWGESAGAHSVGILMASPLSTGLFHQGIMESGAWWDRSHGPLTTFAEARQYGLNFEKKVGVTSLAGLRALSAIDINNAQPFTLKQDPGVTGFAPSVDNYVIPVVPGQAFHDGKQQKVPLLAGFNAKEEFLFEGNALPHSSAAVFENATKILFGDRESDFLSFFPDNTPALLNASSDALVGDLYIREQTWEAAITHYETSGQPVFIFYYNYTSTYSPVASHTAEEPFVFGNLLSNPSLPSLTPPTVGDRAFSEELISYWTTFVKTGNPNSAGQPAWPAFGSSATDFMLLSNHSMAFALPSTISNQLSFIESFRTNGILPYRWRNLSSVGV